MEGKKHYIMVQICEQNFVISSLKEIPFYMQNLSLNFFKIK
jgi:hypothetical protein